MGLPDKVTPGARHRVCAVVLLLTMLCLILQVVLMATVSDERLTEVLRSLMRRERDKHANDLELKRMDPIIYERGLISDAELDRRLEERKGEFILKMREKLDFRSVLPMKGLMCLMLLLISLGLLRGRRSPTRLLAGISVVILAIGTLKSLQEAQATLSTFQLIKGLDSGLDLVLTGLIPLSLIVCVMVAARGLWVKPAEPAAPPPPAA